MMKGKSMDKKMNAKNEKMHRNELQAMFGENLFVNYYTGKEIRNHLRSISSPLQREDLLVGESDYIFTLITSVEVSMLYNKFLPPKKRNGIVEPDQEGTVPQNPDEFNMLVLHSIFVALNDHTKFLNNLIDIYNDRIAEMEKALQKADRVKMPVERRLEEIKTLLALTDIEYECMINVYLNRPGRGHGYRISELEERVIMSHMDKVRNYAKNLGITEEEAVKLFADYGTLRKYGILNTMLEMDQTFLNFLDGLSDMPLQDRFYKRVNLSERDILPIDYYEERFRKAGDDWR